MKKSTILALFLLCTISVFAYNIEVKNTDGVSIYYNYINDKTELEVAYYYYNYKYKGNVVLPETVSYDDKIYSVTKIGSSAFSDCSELTSITIPNSVTSIGDKAFMECSGLTSINIPNSVTSIGSAAFDGCSGLEKVIVSDIAKWCEISFGSGLNSNPLYYAKHLYSDENTEIKNLIIPNSVTSIGDAAFSGCSGLTSITIPNSVTSIGSSAFRDCSGLEKVIVSDIAKWCEISFGYGLISNPLYYAKHLYSDENTEIKNLIIPNSVTSIGDKAFSGCSGLTSVTIPNSVTTIGSYAFYGCSGLTSITIGNSVTSIGSSAFIGCSGLTSVTIPNSVTSIGSSAFIDCSGLTSVTIPESVTSIGDAVFYGCLGLISIKVQEGNPVFDSRGECNAIIETATNTLIEGCKKTLIPNSVISIGYGAFAIRTGPSSVTIPNSVTSIKERAFYNCSSLVSVIIPSSLTTIEKRAFDTCDNLKIIYSLSEYPAFVTLKENPFPMSQNHFKSTLYVKKGLKDVYAQADGWKNFVDIREMTDEQYEELVKKTNGESNQEEQPEETIIHSVVTLSSAGYATFYDDTHNFKLPAGVSALVLTSESGQTLNYKTIASGDANGIVPKGVPVILVSSNRRGGTYTLTSTSESASYSGENLLHGSSMMTMTSNVNGVSTSGNSDYVYYKLAYGKSGSTNANKLGWYWGANNGAAFTIAGGKAWLALPKISAQSIDAILLDDDATSIDGIEQSNMNEANDAQYNMAGQRVGNGYKGIIIINGKKIIR